MEWLIRMNKSIEYIEGCMEGSFDINKAAQIAYSSPYHFQRMFNMLTGATIAEYMRKRRLTLAAQDLASSKLKVLDAALKYGYDTPESFSKAFKKLHGINPSTVREAGVKLKAYPKLSFQISLKGDKDMDYKIVEKAEYKVVGKQMRVSTRDGENFVKIPEFWDKCSNDGTCEKLVSLTEEKIDFLGICLEFDEKQDEFTYVIGVEADIDNVPEGFVTKIIPAAAWAVFESVGAMPNAIQKVWNRIFSEWFPATGYEHAGGPELEVYPEGNPDEEDYRCEVWIPIKKK